VSSPEFGILLVLASNSVGDHIHRAHEAAGFGDIRPAFGVIFRALDVAPLTLTELAAKLGITKQSAAVVVDDMVAFGYLTKGKAASDRRAVQLQLTDRARAAIAIAKDAAKRCERSLTRAVGADTVAAMRVALEHFVVSTGYENELRTGQVRAPW
jgi:DNA-binding MarR family transcriptional regulator